MRKTDAAVGIFRQNFACSQAVLGAFAEELGLDRATACRDLVGSDLSTAAGYEAARQRGVFKELCPQFVATAAALLDAALAEPGATG